MAAGEYATNATVEGGTLALVGRCAALTSIVSDEEEEPLLDLRGASVSARSLRLGGGPGVSVVDGGGLTLEDAVVEDTAGFALRAAGIGSTLDLVDVVVRGNRANPDIFQQYDTRALEVRDGAELRALRVDLESNVATGLRLESGASAVLESCTVKRHLELPPEPDPSTGAPIPFDSGMTGIRVRTGGSLTARDLLIEDVAGIGIDARGEADLDLEDVTIRVARNIAPTASWWAHSDPGGLILTAGFGDQVTLIGRTIVLEGNELFGLYAVGVGASVTVEDLQVLGNRPAQDGIGGWGVVAVDQAVVTVDGLLAADNSSVGAAAVGAGILNLHDADILGTRHDHQVGTGVGLVVLASGEATADALTVSGSSGPGLFAGDGGALVVTNADLSDNGMANVVLLGGDLELRDSTMTAARSSPTWGGGVGIYAWDVSLPSTLVAERVLFGDSPGPGLYARGAGSFQIRDSEFVGNGHEAGVPGGVFASGGLQAWDPAEQAGLLVEDSTFTDLAGDGVLLDQAGITLVGDEFTDVALEPLYVQHCLPDEPHEVVVVDQPGVDPACRTISRPTAPQLEYWIFMRDLTVESVAPRRTSDRQRRPVARPASPARRAPSTRHAVDLNEGLDDTLVMLGGLLRPGVTVTRDYGTDLVDVMAHGGELNQVWTNLIDNAVAAMAGEGALAVRTRREGEEVVVQIADSGPGIPGDLRDRVFDPFVTSKPVGQGTGLGLNISHHIVVQKHGGTITFDSNPSGTCFEVRLPIAPSAGS